MHESVNRQWTFFSPRPYICVSLTTNSSNIFKKPIKHNNNTPQQLHKTMPKTKYHYKGMTKNIVKIFRNNNDEK